MGDQLIMTWWHCGSCGWSQPGWGIECEECGEDDLTPEDAEEVLDAGEKLTGSASIVVRAMPAAAGS